MKSILDRFRWSGPRMTDEPAERPAKVPSIKRIHTILSVPLRQAGFSKTGPLWSKRVAESILLVHPQRSSWSDSYFINLAADYLSPRDRRHPVEHEADVRERLDQLMPEQRRPELKDSLDFETSLTDPERSRVIHEAIISWGLPFLNRYSTLDGIRSAQRDDPGFSRVAIRLELVKLL